MKKIILISLVMFNYMTINAQEIINYNSSCDGIYEPVEDWGAIFIELEVTSSVDWDYEMKRITAGEEDAYKVYYNDSEFVYQTDDKDEWGNVIEYATWFEIKNGKTYCFISNQYGTEEFVQIKKTNLK